MIFFYFFTALLLIVAVGFDITKRTIPNWLTMAGVIGGLSATYVLFGRAGFSDHFVGMLIAGGVWFIFWYTGIMGGGDQKLMMAVGANLGSRLAIMAIFLVAAAGGIQAILWVVARAFTTGDAKSWKNLLHETKLPYSLAIAVGTSAAVILDEFHILSRCCFF